MREKQWVSRFGILVVVLCAQLSPSAQGKAVAAPFEKTSVRVPFVGCKSDGQLGPQEAPHGRDKVVPITAEAAQRLAYYKSEDGFGVLAPRGWYCFGTYGSSGSALYVAPEPIRAADLFSSTWKGFSGPAIELAISVGDTSGRFEVAKIIARAFPAHRSFVQSVIDEKIEPPSSFPFGPYPEDRLKYRSTEMVEYQTPANTDGLGTDSRLLKNADPIHGVEMLFGADTNLLSLSVRLPQNLADLTSIIIQQVERDGMVFSVNER